MKPLFFYMLFLFCISCARKEVACSHGNYTIRDSVIYVIDTVYVHHYIDTVVQPVSNNSDKKFKSLLKFNPSNLGVGPSFGGYYSPFHGFDLLLGFGVQYYFTNISFGRAKMRHHPGFHHKK